MEEPRLEILRLGLKARTVPTFIGGPARKLKIGFVMMVREI